jgi:hypothetical protein
LPTKQEDKYVNLCTVRVGLSSAIPSYVSAASTEASNEMNLMCDIFDRELRNSNLVLIDVQPDTESGAIVRSSYQLLIAIRPTSSAMRMPIVMRSLIPFTEALGKRVGREIVPSVLFTSDINNTTLRAYMYRGNERILNQDLPHTFLYEDSQPIPLQTWNSTSQKLECPLKLTQLLSTYHTSHGVDRVKLEVLYSGRNCPEHTMWTLRVPITVLSVPSRLSPGTCPTIHPLATFVVYTLRCDSFGIYKMAERQSKVNGANAATFSDTCFDPVQTLIQRLQQCGSNPLHSKIYDVHLAPDELQKGSEYVFELLVLHKDERDESFTELLDFLLTVCDGEDEDTYLGSSMESHFFMSHAIFSICGDNFKVNATESKMRTIYALIDEWKFLHLIPAKCVAGNALQTCKQLSQFTLELRKCGVIGTPGLVWSTPMSFGDKLVTLRKV